MQMDVQIQRAAETLDQGDDSGASAAPGHETRPVGQIGLDSTDDDGEAATKSVGPAGEQQAQGPGEAEHPLPDGDLWNDVVDQMCRGLDHPPCAAGRAEAPTLAGEGDKVFMVAAVALHAHEAVFQSAAAQVVLELAQDEAGQCRLVMLQFIPQGRKMLLDDRIERRVLWLMALVAVICANRAVSGNSFHGTRIAGWTSPSQWPIAWRDGRLLRAKAAQ